MNPQAIPNTHLQPAWPQSDVDEANKMGMSQEHLQQLMMLAGLGLICWLLMRGRMRRRQGQILSVDVNLGHNQNAQTRVAPFSGTRSLGAPAEVLKWQVELHDLGRELKAELDSKLIAVRSMTTAYDQAARRLAEMIRLAEQVNIAPTRSTVEADQKVEAGLPIEAGQTIQAGQSVDARS